MKPDLLVFFELPSERLAPFRKDYTVHHAPDPEHWERALGEARDRIRAVVTTGVAGFSDEQMQGLPALEIIAVLGVGYENVDVEAARVRGIAVARGEEVNGDITADHAMALLLSAARSIPQRNSEIHQGLWNSTTEGDVTGQRLGIVGLGDIGARVARRAEGFGMDIAYHNRSPRAGSSYRYADSTLALARDSDFLALTCPGGPSTFHLVDAAVLDALGPKGILVNVARGSVVDTGALVKALEQGRIAAAALDVLESEPEIPEALRRLDNLIVTPHVAGKSPTSVRAITQAALDNLAAHFAGRPLPNPV